MLTKKKITGNRKQGSDTAIKMVPFLLAVAMTAVSLTGCRLVTEYRESRAQAEEESRQQLIKEIGESHREYNEKRQTFLQSELHEAGVQYLEDALDELMPGCEKEISLEPGGYLDAGSEELNTVPRTKEDWVRFYAKAALSFYVNHDDYGIEPEEVCRKLMERGISGDMNADRWRSDRWYFHAGTGETEFYMRPGI